MTIETFFTRYATLALGSEPEALAALYAPTFIVGGPQGSQAFTNDARLLDWLRQVSDFNRQHGMRSLAVHAVRGTTLSPLHTLATVTWDAQFEKTDERVIEFEITYLLEQVDDGWQILSYISRSNQDETMAQEGLL